MAQRCETVHVLHDEATPDATYFDTSNKDTMDISNWACKTENNPEDKADIMHLYAVAFRPTSGKRAGHILVYVALERYANTGDADVGF